MSNSISPNYTFDDFPEQLSLQDKIKIFNDRINGWQIDIAQQCITNIAHSGFAVLNIISSYFEMIAKFKDGYTKEGNSGLFFKRAFKEFLSVLHHYEEAEAKIVADKAWKGIRCSLDHTGITRGAYLSSEFNVSIRYSEKDNILYLNPHLLVPELKEYFGLYIEELNKPENEELQRKFILRYDAQYEK